MLHQRNSLIHVLNLATVITCQIQKKEQFICDKEHTHVEYITQLLELKKKAELNIISETSKSTLEAPADHQLHAMPRQMSFSAGRMLSSNSFWYSSESPLVCFISMRWYEGLISKISESN